MNTKIRQSRAPRHGRLAAVALAGAVAGTMLLPLDLGVASASTGFPAVEAGGPPSKPAPTRHVTKTRYVPREKPILHVPHRWRPPRLDVIVDNDNRSHNRHHRFHRHHDWFRHERLRHEPFRHEHRHDPVKEEPVKEEPMKEEPIREEPIRNDDRKWWWPEELS
ncbi:hypothetical protein GCM10022224_004870 [Nonomuraea antimicrobica]|uniref:Secreted protein n=1 Tax=Nonomuraea antimicrobica TaxID=561173 RepID=A0ABP7B0H9_9ACTN